MLLLGGMLLLGRLVLGGSVEVGGGGLLGGMLVGGMLVDGGVEAAVARRKSTSSVVMPGLFTNGVTRFRSPW